MKPSLFDLYETKSLLLEQRNDLLEAGRKGSAEYREMKVNLETVNTQIMQLKATQSFPIANPNWAEDDKWFRRQNPAAAPNEITFYDANGKAHRAFSAEEKLAEVHRRVEGITSDSFGKILRARILGDFSGLTAAEAKAAGEGTGAGGGWMVPESLSPTVIDLARAKSVVNQAGARTIEMETPEMTLIKVTSDPTAYWRKESAAITESEGAFEPLTLKAVTCGVLVRASLELIADSPQAQSTITNMMTQALAQEMDRVALLGDGAGEPRGLDACTGVNEISKGANGATITNYDDFSNACEDIAEENGEAGAVIYAPRTHYTIDRLKAATTNQPLTPPASFARLRKFFTSKIPITDTKGSATNCSKAYVGDFTNILYGIRQNMSIDASKSGGGSSGNDAFAQMEVLIRAFLRMDVAVVRENHFTKIVGIKV